MTMILTNQERFSATIAEIKDQLKQDIIECIVYFCEENECEILDIIPLIDRTMKEEVWEAAKKERYILHEDVGMLFP